MSDLRDYSGHREEPDDAGNGRGLSFAEACSFLALLLILAWLFGTYSRFPFDDEIYTLDVIHMFDLPTLFSKLLGGYDVHPPLSYMLFGALAKYGVPPSAMRIVSLLLTGFGFLLVLDLALPSIPARQALARPLTVFLFAAFPLIYGAGDALRWYPLLTALVALFFWLEIKRGRPGIPAGLALGLAASTNYLAIIPYLAFAFRRYLVARRFCWREDGPFHVAILCTAWAGLWTFAAVATPAVTRGAPDQFLTHAGLAKGAAAVAQTLLGFFGGYRLGLIDGFITLPYLVLLLLCACMLPRTLRRWPTKSPQATALVLVAALLAVAVGAYSLLSGFDRARAFLFVAPFVTAMMAIGYWRSSLGTHSPTPLLVASFLLIGGALANAQGSSDPFKRNLAIPFGEVMQFVADNTDGEVLFASSESVSAYLMRRAGHCTVAWDSAPPSCLGDAADFPGDLARFRYIVVARNHNFASQVMLPKIDAYVQEARALVAKARFGSDRTAAPKSRLIGTPLSPWLLEVEIYR